MVFKPGNKIGKKYWFKKGHSGFKEKKKLESENWAKDPRVTSCHVR